ncbi:MAG: hypothetical protein U0941_07025 [Planctomycetaceae bacterium]
MAVTVYQDVLRGQSLSGRCRMAKPLVFHFKDGDFAFGLNKVDRSRLYGYKEVEVLDEKGRKCELATLGGDGHTVIGRGGSSFAQLSVDGEWCDKSSLRPVDTEGREITPVPSSYSAPVALTEPTTVADYLQHNIRLVYVLEPEGDASSLFEELKSGAVYKFPYSYRGGLEADAGFLIQGADGNFFMAVGNPTRVEFIGPTQISTVEEEAGADDVDMMDFDMI